MNKIKTYLSILMCILCVGCLSAARLNVQTAIEKDTDKLHNETLTSQEKMGLILKMAEKYVGYAETHDIYVESDAYETGSGFFEAGGWGVAWGRGGSNLSLVYAVLLSEQPSRQTFTKYNIPRSQLVSHLRNHLRALCIANINCSRYPGDEAVPHKWGGPAWQSSLDFIAAAWASHLIESELDADTLTLTEEIVKLEADNLVPPAKEFPNTTDMGDTKSEDCCWNAPFLAFAANKFSDDPRASNWDYYGKKWAMNAMRTTADASVTDLVDGVAVKDWMIADSVYPNLYPDLSLENHGFWSVGYQIQMMMLADGELAYQVFGKPIPEAYSYHADQMWEDIGSVITLSDGDYIYATGQDWFWKSYTQVQYFARQAICRGDARAAALESRALQSAYLRQRANGLGDMGYDFGTSTAGLKRHMFTYLLHKHFPNSRKRDYTEMDAVQTMAAGIHNFPYVKVAIHRTADKAVSVAWQADRHPIYVIPNKEDSFENPSLHIPYDLHNGVASVSVTSGSSSQTRTIVPATITDDNGAMIARYQRKWGSAVTQYITVVSLSDEATVYLTHFKADAASTVTMTPLFPYDFAYAPGYEDRTFTQYRGEKWVNVNDCMGFVSPDSLPASMASNKFILSGDQNFTVSAGEWFCPAAVVVYVYQNHGDTEAFKDSVTYESSSTPGQLILNVPSSSGTTQVSLF